ARETALIPPMGDRSRWLTGVRSCPTLLTTDVRNICITLAFFAIPAAAQWLDYPTPGIPRTKDGKPNLSAPTPRTPDGKPDFSGTWQAAGTKYLDNLGADGVQIPMQPWA